MNTGGDPGRDDYGLPPVDIEIPDDARELDREMQAYYRELRSQRWRSLAKKVYGPLASDGMVLPLLAGCLALTLLAATLLTVFTVRQGTVGGPAAHAHAPPAMSAPQGQVGGPLPDAMVMLDGRPTFLRDLIGQSVVVFALIPPGCGCFGDLRELAREAAPYAQTYLVGTRGEDTSPLAPQLGLGPAHAVQAAQNLTRFYSGRTTLTAVLVGKDGLIARLVPDRHGFQITAELQWLASPGGTQPSISSASPAG